MKSFISLMLTTIRIIITSGGVKNGMSSSFITLFFWSNRMTSPRKHIERCFFCFIWPHLITDKVSLILIIWMSFRSYFSWVVLTTTKKRAWRSTEIKVHHLLSSNNWKTYENEISSILFKFFWTKRKKKRKEDFDY